MVSVPIALMILVTIGMTGIEQWFSEFGKTETGRPILGRIGIALPYIASAATGIIVLFASVGSTNIKLAGWGVVGGSSATIVIAVLRETVRLAAIFDHFPAVRSALSYVGNAAFARSEPRRIRGRRALHGEAEWMKSTEAGKLFPDTGGIVIGERYRVDKDIAAKQSFRADSVETWGAGGKSPLLCFDGSFGSSHGIVFAGSGGFKTTSVTIPTALKWGGTLVLLDPSNEVAPMVIGHRTNAGRDVHILDPRTPDTGFNALDWIGLHGRTKEEDIAAVAS
ncbi:type IV secretory pathway TraG/TraD family ATPase VirD4 [Rhizobium ruizarguesonis]